MFTLKEWVTFWMTIRFVYDIKTFRCTKNPTCTIVYNMKDIFHIGFTFCKFVKLFFEVDEWSLAVSGTTL